MLDKFMSTPECEVQRLRVVTVNITHKCNLHCSYCYVKERTPKSITKEELKRIIDKEAENNTESGIEISFLGGEPLVEFELIQWAIQYCKEYQPNVRRFSVVSNGTLITDEIFQWFQDNRDIINLIISYDGNEEVQNAQRDNSYDGQFVEKYLREYGMPGINITITPTSLPTLAQDIMAIHALNDGCIIRAVRAENINYSDDMVDIYKEQLEILYQYYLSHPDVLPASLFNMEYMLSLDFDGPHDCGSGDYKFGIFRFYDIDGTSSCCNYLLPLSGGVPAEVMDTIKYGVPHIPDKCAQCPSRYVCCYCYGKNYALTGDPLTPDVDGVRCELKRVELVYLARFILTSTTINYYGFNQYAHQFVIDKSKEILRFFKEDEELCQQFVDIK